MAEVSRHSFDLARDLPLYARLIVLGPDEHVLVLVVHHIAADGWSLATLQHDLATAYTARRVGKAPDWTPLPVQYADYALWQRQLLGDLDRPGQPVREAAQLLAGGPGRATGADHSAHRSRVSARGVAAR